jgi:DNA-binding winged helix-turn-helix (wHTH) protein/tetratricopeptide (TPR) repeat protein
VDGIVEFGPFELDLARAELRKEGALVNLPPQPLRVLVLLASRPGELVARGQLRHELWGDNTTVDFEHGLNTCIRQIRAALGENARSWRFVETVHRRGYRFHLNASGAPAPGPRYFRVAAGFAACAALLAAAGYVTASRRIDARLSQAHDLVVQGRVFSARLTSDAQRNAIASFEKALTLNARSAEAYAGLALAYQRMAGDFGVRRAESLPKVEQAAKAALATDGNSSEAHVAMAEVRWRKERDERAAEAEFGRALTLDPNNAEAHARFGVFLYLRGRFAEGAEELRKSLTLDASSAWANYELGCLKYYSRDYDGAITQLHRTLEIDSRYAWAHHVLGLALEAKRQYDESIAEFEKSQRGPSGNLGHALALAGRRDDATKMLDQLKSRYHRDGIGAGDIARVYVGLGEYDKAFEWLGTAVADGNPTNLAIAPVFDPIRNDPRFQELLRKTGQNQ